MSETLPKISQSLIKNYYDYLQGNLCGIVFEQKYITKTLETPPSDAMAEGIYFEYLCTGALPRNGIVPEPELTKKGELTAEYKRISEAATLFKRIINEYKINILEVGKVISTAEENGIVDIWGEWNGEKVIIDIKYSGLIDDKWSDMGWETENLPNKDKLMIQGVHYSYIIQETLGIENIPFYYFIFNSKDPSDCKIIRQNIDPDKIQNHKVTLRNVKESLSRSISVGFKAIPDYRKCRKCALFQVCEKRAAIPQVTTIDY